MKRVSSAPGLSEMGATASTAQHAFKTPAVLAAGPMSKVCVCMRSDENFCHPQNPTLSLTDCYFYHLQHSRVSSGVKTSAIAMDAPVDSALPLSPGPSGSEIVYSLTSRGLTSLECLPSIEMKDAPPVDIAFCMATPVVPDEGPGAEVRERAANMAAQAEAQLRLRYAEEIAARAAVRVRRMCSKKRSLDDLDLFQAKKEGGGSPKPSPKRSPKPNKQDQQQQDEESRKGNVKPFKRPAATVAVKISVAGTN